MATQKFLQEPPSVDELQNLVSTEVYVGPDKMRAEIKTCEKIWKNWVAQSEAGKKGYHGEIRDYEGTGKPWTTGDLRDTWTLCLVKKGKVYRKEYFLPWQKANDDSTYDYDRDLAEKIHSGEISLAEGKKLAQEFSETIAQSELEEDLDGGRYERMTDEGF